ncbi:Dyp-type peroxidase [Streptomyces sp. NPDC047061]|uniref:Dyp-type peroxidase n=1 Tax=Streptomyces sp. NPDC047061 TaxID=3154605 RepID=UPI003401A3B9
MGTETETAPLELDDIQAGALRGRPNPYAGAFLFLRIDDPQDGRTLVRRLAKVVHPADDVTDPLTQTSFSAAFTHAGLCALGVPEESLASFAPEFVQGMAARAGLLGDVGPNAPERWESPLGSDDVHMVLVMLAPNRPQFEQTLELARVTIDDLDGITGVYRQDVFSPADGRNSFGFNDGISQPCVEGAGIPPTNPGERPVKPGEFILGYEDETGSVAPVPQPEVLGRNGSYLVIRKLYTDVAAWRRYLRENASGTDEETLLAAKIVGRWPSGAPLALSPDEDDPELGSDPSRNNVFLYGDDDKGLKCPVGSHARRMNPRDAQVVGEIRLHRLIRRAATFGPALPEGVLEDDGADRGLMFAAINAHLGRQFEFVQAQWIGDGKFVGAPDEVDPLAGAHEDHGTFTVPRRPIRRRLRDLPTFVVNRGGHYFFVPGLSALRWIADLAD